AWHEDDSRARPGADGLGRKFPGGRQGAVRCQAVLAWKARGAGQSCKRARQTAGQGRGGTCQAVGRLQEKTGL
ncbi:MAG: hypothetical protein AVDCRST_MAG44-1449, partial [uncultured Sphingomonas sp.]